MSYSDDLIKLRKRMLDAVSSGFLDQSNKDLYEATLIQIMNESERQRQACVARAEDLRRQAAIADGQAAAFSQVSSIIYNVINGFITVNERNKEEENRIIQEKLEIEKNISVENISNEKVKKGRKHSA